MKLIDITGQRFGRLLVIQKDQKPRQWLCICDCGNQTLATGPNLRRGGTRSCGCLASEWASKLGAAPEFVAKRSLSVTKHGHKKRQGMSAEYRTWLGMKRRCQDEKSKDFPNWGGRGITVCSRWDESFEAFLADMGRRPPGRTIDRLDPNGPYAPENCRWATLKEQGSENRRSLRPVTVNGVDFQTLLSACKHFDINPSKARQRIESGISVDVALTFGGRLPSRRTRESYIAKSRR